MADTKISALPLASTPLAGTEVLPIVQGGITEQIATNDLTVRNVRANATTGILQVTGPAAASTRVMTVPNANFTVARTDAAQSFTGDQTLSTGNLVIGTSGKGIDFSATPGTGTSELFADYEEGTWTPTYAGSGSNPTVTYVVNVGTYTKIGRMVYWSVEITTTACTGGSGTLQIAGFPFACGSRYTGGAVINYANGWTTAAPNVATIFNGATVMPLYADGTTTFSDVAVGNLTNSTVYLIAFGAYSV